MDRLCRRIKAGHAFGLRRQNRVIEYAAVMKLGIPSAQAHLQANFPDGIPLDTAFVGPELVQQLDAAVEEAISAEQW